MKQTRLNHLMILHVHKENADSLNLHDIGKERMRCSEQTFSIRTFLELINDFRI